MPKRRSNAKVSWVKEKTIEERIDELWEHSGLPPTKRQQVICVKSENAATRAYARIWGLPRIWQETLMLNPTYVLEVVSEKYYRLSDREQDEVLLHELAHIPNNFSGALVAHTRRGKGSFHSKLKKMVGKYRNR